ncbi:MAG: hypothetical protein KFB95_03315 [Simkaniaceae bacterium]|nr:MAG: hypothetical protein KFB95_03315 [Simkaniaceae bacterium]
MKKFLVMFACLLSFGLHTLEYERQFENDQICVSKVKVLPHEKIDEHRDDYSQMIIALKGGTITRIEQDGRLIDVDFPTGATVFRKADPEGELHRAVNNSSETVELIVIQFKEGTKDSKENRKLAVGAGNDPYEVAVDIRIDCPMSEELQAFRDSIPVGGPCVANFEEWKLSFIENMTKLIQLVESEQVANSNWSVHVDPIKD